MSTCAGKVLTLPLGLDMKKLKYARFELSVFVITRLVRMFTSEKLYFETVYEKLEKHTPSREEKLLNHLIGMNKKDEM